MIINIELNDELSPMWFLKDENHDIHLTYMVKGPVPVNFDILSDSNKDFLYSSMISGFVKPVGVSFKEVSEVYLNVKQKKEEEVKETVPEEIVEYNNKVQKTELERKEAESELRRYKQIQKREDKLKLISSSSMKAVRSAISKMTDIHELLRLLEIERAGKNRKQVKDYAEKKILSLKKQISKNIEKDSKKGKFTEKEKQMIGELEHSENEYISFVVEGIIDGKQ